MRTAFDHTWRVPPARPLNWGSATSSRHLDYYTNSSHPLFIFFFFFFLFHHTLTLGTGWKPFSALHSPTCLGVPDSPPCVRPQHVATRYGNPNIVGDKPCPKPFPDHHLLPLSDHNLTPNLEYRPASHHRTRAVTPHPSCHVTYHRAEVWAMGATTPSRPRSSP